MKMSRDTKLEGNRQLFEDEKDHEPPEGQNPALDPLAEDIPNVRVVGLRCNVRCGKFG